MSVAGIRRAVLSFESQSVGRSVKCLSPPAANVYCALKKEAKPDPATGFYAAGRRSLLMTRHITYQLTKNPTTITTPIDVNGNYHFGVLGVNQPWDVTNETSITANEIGIGLYDGGSVTNTAGGLINASTDWGVVFKGAAGTVNNYGTIESTATHSSTIY